MFYCWPNVIETSKKTLKFFHLTRVTLGGGGGQDGKWSHFPPFFNPLLINMGILYIMSCRARFDILDFMEKFCTIRTKNKTFPRQVFLKIKKKLVLVTNERRKTKNLVRHTLGVDAPL